jgi:hypothetical protein
MNTTGSKKTLNLRYRGTIMKRIVCVLIACILVTALMGCSGNSNTHEGEARTPSGSIHQKGEDYQKVIDNFEKKGFKNIRTEKLEDLILGWFTKDGEVESVSVDGNEDYSPDVWYPNDVEVVITYHTFPQRVKSTSTTPAENNNDTENLVEDKPETVEQSTAEPTKENVQVTLTIVKTEPVKQPTREPTKEKRQEILTIENNEDMAALFKTGDFDPFISKFAKKYSGRIIQFDGYIANMTLHENSTTRYNLLIYTGNYGEKSGNALSFKFEDINIVSDLKLTGSNIPDYIREGQNLRITAKVGEYKENSGLFFLKPVSTEIR